MISNDQYFGSISKAAKELAAAEKRGNVPDQMDFSVQEACAVCQQPITPPKKVLRCSACKAVIYCSKECSKRDWNFGPRPDANAPTHKQLCPENARHMQRLSATQEIVKQFPWGRVEKDGSFSLDIARGRYGVLGADGFGFWSHRGGPVPHANQGPFNPQAQTGYSAQITQMLKSFDHLDGLDLLGKKHLTDAEGWKLPAHLIPHRHFTSLDTRPVLVTDFGEAIKDWNTWYKWRKIPKESPAALLLDFPMSVYQLVVNCLHVTDPKAGKADSRVPLHIHLLGAEVELNYLPLFSELALLLPYHDIKLVLFGFTVYKLVKEAKTKAPGSLAGKASPQTPVFTYDAPKECGAGAISIVLHGESPTWSHPAHTGSASPYGGRPDAIVACNAGLASYREWIPVVQAAHELELPFGTTEYAEQSAEAQRDAFPKMLSPHVRPRKDYAIDLNPFQKPGQRGIPTYRLPNIINGFTITVVKKDHT